MLGAGSTTRAVRSRSSVNAKCQQRSGRHALGHAFLQPLAQFVFGGVIELAPAQVSADACEMGALGGGPLGVG